MVSGYQTLESDEDDVRGGYVEDDTCYAVNYEDGSSAVGVRAVARCCDLSAYSVECNTYQSLETPDSENAKQYMACPSTETLMGWYVHAMTCALHLHVCHPHSTSLSEYRLNGNYPGTGEPESSAVTLSNPDTWYVSINVRR